MALGDIARNIRHAPQNQRVQRAKSKYDPGARFFTERATTPIEADEDGEPGEVAAAFDDFACERLQTPDYTPPLCAFFRVKPKDADNRPHQRATGFRTIRV